jgi:hypothetical protein
MLGRRQEINLQLTESLDSALLGFCHWFANFLRSVFEARFWAKLAEILPIEKL